jgi:gamma-carbonic anhydrase
MAHLITLPEMKIQIDPSVFLAPTAQIIGNVFIKEKSSIWYNCVLRGDVMPIVIGKETNIQDGTVVHGTYKKFGTTIGDRVTVGHQCTLHGCTIGDEAFIGMGALIMDGCVVAPRSFIGAGALLTEGTKTESEMLYLGRPAKAIRKLTESEAQFLKQSAENYKFYTTWYGPDHFAGTEEK